MSNMFKLLGLLAKMGATVIISKPSISNGQYVWQVRVEKGRKK